MPKTLPRALSEELWIELFAAMRCHRDRAILAAYISSGVRASELLGMTCGDIDFGHQTITVVSKGTRVREPVPVSPDALVWIRLWLAEGRVWLGEVKGLQDTLEALREKTARLEQLTAVGVTDTPASMV